MEKFCVEGECWFSIPRLVMNDAYASISKDRKRLTVPMGRSDLT
jgi:hypothetical protein